MSPPPLRPDGREAVYGRNPVRELLAAGAREVHEVWALPQLAGEEWLAGAPVREANRDKLGRLSGTAGCNNYSAALAVSGDSLLVSARAATRRACPS